MYLLQHISPNLRDSALLGEGWMFFVFLVIAALLAIVRWNYASNLKELFTAVINLRLLREILREEIVLTSRASQLLIVLAFLSVSLFFYLCFSHWNYQLLNVDLSGFLYYLLILSCLVGIYFVKILMFQSMKLVFDGDFSLTEYEFNYGLLLKLVGVWLLPISLILSCFSVESQEFFIYSGWVLLTLSLLWRWIRGASNAMANRISIVYIILYLCTLEFLPAAVLLKVLI